MKKMILCCIFLPLIFSCSINNWNDTIISNNSEFDITFKFSNTKQINISTGEQTIFPTGPYQRLETYSPDKKVYFTYSSTNDGYTGEFHTRQSWPVEISNNIGVKATLSADGWMDDVVINGTISTGKVYTDKPNFTVKAESDFPAVAVYNRDPDGTFKVTIQRN